jgi:hypothetical protein
MADRAFIADCEIYGPRLDVDRLLETVVRRARCVVWRVGDLTEFGPQSTAGIRMPVYHGNFQSVLERTIATFVRREAALLRAARKLTGPVRGWDTQARLSTSVFVGAENPVAGVTFPVALLQVAARGGVDLAVGALLWNRNEK